MIEALAGAVFGALACYACVSAHLARKDAAKCLADMDVRAKTELVLAAKIKRVEDRAFDLEQTAIEVCRVTGVKRRVKDG